MLCDNVGICFKSLSIFGQTNQKYLFNFSNFPYLKRHFCPSAIIPSNLSSFLPTWNIFFLKNIGAKRLIQIQKDSITVNSWLICSNWWVGLHKVAIFVQILELGRKFELGIDHGLIAVCLCVSGITRGGGAGMAIEQGRIPGPRYVLRYSRRQSGARDEPPEPGIGSWEQQQQQQQQFQQQQRWQRWLRRQLLQQPQSPDKLPRPGSEQETEEKSRLRQQLTGPATPVVESSECQEQEGSILHPAAIASHHERRRLRRRHGKEVLALPSWQDTPVASRAHGAENPLQRVRRPLQVGAVAARVPAGQQPDVLERASLEFAPEGGGDEEAEVCAGGGGSSRGEGCLWI